MKIKIFILAAIIGDKIITKKIIIN